MKTAVLDGSMIQDMQMLHEELKTQLNFPSYYGNNLDALHDVLTETTEESWIIVKNTPKLADTLQTGWGRFLRVIQDSQEEGSKLTLILKG